MLVCITLLLGLAADDLYRWPLDLPRELTSSFGEYRPGRCHAGIDLRTGGVGIPVYASGDGYVSRVRCSPYGYGKAVYLTLANGYTIVHGHLDDYYPELRDFVRQAQHKARNYTVDLQLQPSQFRVIKGQLLAKAGQTGIGAPHLHYEWRDARERPIDPRQAGLTWPDNVRPVIRRVLVSPNGPGCTVNGDLIPVVLEAHARGAGAYECDPITAAGEIGFGVDLVDPASGGAYKLGVYRISASAGGQEIFRIQNDVFSYEHRDDGTACFHPYFKEGAPFQVLWRWPGNESEVYTHATANGWWIAPATATEVVIEAVDFNQNTARVTLPIRPANKEASAAPPGAGAGRATANLDCFGEFITATVQFTAPEPESPSGVVASNSATQPLAFVRVNKSTFRASFKAAKTDGYRIHVEHARLEPAFDKPFAAFVRGQAGTVRLGDLTLSTEPDTPYGVLYAAVDGSDSPKVSKEQTLTPVGPVYRVWPAEAPVDAPVTLTWPQPAGEKTPFWGVYRSGGGAWALADATIANGRIALKTRKFGSFALFSDTTPPALSDVKPKAGAVLTTKRPEVSAAVRDAGCGIQDIEVTCGGEWLLTAYDPEHDRIYWEQDRDLPAGPQSLQFVITDRAGNTTRLTREITLPAS